MWKTSSILFFGGITFILLIGSFFYYKGKLSELQTQNAKVANYYENQFDSLVMARTDSVKQLFADSIKNSETALEQVYLDSVFTFNDEIQMIQRRLHIHEVIPVDVEAREKLKANGKVIERKIRLKSFEGIYEEPTTKILLFGQITSPNNDVTVKLTIPGSREFEENWLIGEVYYYKFDDTDFHIEIFVEAVSEDYADILLQIY